LFLFLGAIAIFLFIFGWWMVAVPFFDISLLCVIILSLFFISL
jgi:hypothetical protein